MKCEEIIKETSKFSVVRKCEVIKNNNIRISTPFQYPDRSYIDLFFSQTEDMFDSYLSDYGFTFAFLTDMQLKPWGTKKRKHIVSDICEAFGVELIGGDLRIKIPKVAMNNFSDYVVRLSQACIRVADLIFTTRLKSFNPFNEIVEEYIDSVGLNYDTDILIKTKYNSDLTIDYLVYGKRVESYVLSFSSANQNASHSQCNEIFRKWHDISHIKESKQFVTIYDSMSGNYREDDLLRLKEVSNVIGFPAEENQLPNVEFAEIAD